MVVEVRVPNFAESISEVTVTSLLVPSNTNVQENQGIAEIESEKVNHLIYAPISGKVHWEVEEGAVVSVGTILATIDPSDKEETIQDNVNTELPKSEVSDLSKEGPNLVKKSPTEIIDFPSEPPQDKRFVPFKDAMPNSERESRQRMTSIRKTISRRLLKALHESAMSTTFNEMNLTALMQVRKQHQERFISNYGVKLGLMSFFIKASVAALKEFPQLNAYIDGDDVVYRHYYDLCIAIGVDRGLVAPVLRNCDQLSMAEIEQQLQVLTSKAKEGSLSFTDLQGGGFTITNGGVYGSMFSTPLLNPPQLGILGMHKIEKRPIVQNDSIVVADMMYVALSYDHRMIDGKEAVGFLVRIKELIETPESLLDS